MIRMLLAVVYEMFDRMFPAANKLAVKHERYLNVQLTKHQRFELATELCRRIKASPDYIFESQSIISDKEFYIDNVKLIRLLDSRGLLTEHNISIYDEVRKKYGTRVIELVNMLSR